MFERLRERLGLLSKKAEPSSEEGVWKISPRALEDILWDLEVALMEADVAVEVLQDIKQEMSTELADKRIKWGTAEQIVETALRRSIERLLSENTCAFDEVLRGIERPAVLMFVGVNGTGKTTAIAKIAHRLLKQGMSVVLAAGDTFRAGAIEQISLHAERLGIKVVRHSAGGDPAAVAYDAVEHAKARHKDVVLIDTAGRMQTNRNLMDEMKKMKRVVAPDLTIFVGDALSGNDAVEQARTFEAAVGLDMVILTKIDADTKGGAALSIARVVKKPIAFIGTGQGYEDLIPFDPQWMVSRLFG
ncbi:MAG: signal recognition particle-docking protein FtsY [Candidatus Thermoplasmatota archaeon]